MARRRPVAGVAAEGKDWHVSVSVFAGEERVTMIVGLFGPNWIVL